MSKLMISYNGTDYTLEFTRDSVKKMEQKGFVITEVQERPMTMLPELFYGAFIAHHPYINKKLVTEMIFPQMKGRQALVAKLGEMYGETLNTLFDSEEESGNVEWTEA